MADQPRAEATEAGDPPAEEGVRIRHRVEVEFGSRQQWCDGGRRRVERRLDRQCDGLVSRWRPVGRGLTPVTSCAEPAEAA
jgi:hypothetical protein